MVRLWFLAGIVLAIVIVAAACGGGGGEEPAEDNAEEVLAKEVAEDSRRAQRPGQRTVTEEQPVRVAAEGEVNLP